jgi:hypothetical protein
MPSAIQTAYALAAATMEGFVSDNVPEMRVMRTAAVVCAAFMANWAPRTAPAFQSPKPLGWADSMAPCPRNPSPTVSTTTDCSLAWSRLSRHRLDNLHRPLAVGKSRHRLDRVAVREEERLRLEEIGAAEAPPEPSLQVARLQPREPAGTAGPAESGSANPSRAASPPAAAAG